MTTMTREELIEFLGLCFVETNLRMFVAMSQALDAENYESAWKFYLNDLDKIVSDKEYRLPIEAFFKTKEYLCLIPVR